MTISEAKNPAIRVAIVDDQPLIRAGFKMVIDSQSDMQVVAQCGDGIEAIKELSQISVDVVLMDIRMPNLDGLQATSELIKLWCNEGNRESKIIILTTFDLDEYALDAIQRGASGFLLKDAPPEEMLAAIRTIHSGDAVIAPSTTRRLLDRLVGTNISDPSLVGEDLPGIIGQLKNDARTRAKALLENLTERENQVLLLMARGMSNKEISAQLYVAEATVKTHVGKILAKLSARDRVQAVVCAYEAGVMNVDNV